MWLKKIQIILEGPNQNNPLSILLGKPLRVKIGQNYQSIVVLYHCDTIGNLIELPHLYLQESGHQINYDYY